MKTYRVTAPRKVFGVQPGETFERDIPPVQEAQLLRGGAIEVVEDAVPDPDPDPDPAASESQEEEQEQEPEAEEPEADHEPDRFGGFFTNKE